MAETIIETVIDNVSVPVTSRNTNQQDPHQPLRDECQVGFSNKRIDSGMDSFDSEQPEDEIYGEEKNHKILRKIIVYAQQVFLLLCWLTFTYFLMINEETEQDAITLSVPQGEKGLEHIITKDVLDTSLVLRIYGPFIKTSFRFQQLESSHHDIPNLAVRLYELDKQGGKRKLKTFLHLHLLEYEAWQKSKIEVVEKILEDIDRRDVKYMLQFKSNINHTIPVQISYDFTMVSQKSGLILAVVLLVVFYMHIMFELVHRTLAGVVCCTLGVGIIAAVHLRPPLPVIFNEWGNIDTIMLFFGVSIIVELIIPTGVQDYLAALSYQLANGHIWPMLHCVLLATCLLVNIVDDIFLVLLIAPICLRLCEIMELNCVPVLSCLIIAINLGSTLTPIGSIINSLITKSPFIPDRHVDFGDFVMHIFPATILTLAQSYLQLRIQYRDSTKMHSIEPLQVRRLKHMIKVWRRTSHYMGDYTLDNRLARKSVHKRILTLREKLKRLGRMPEKPHGFEETVQNLRENFPLKNLQLLVICLVALFIALIISILSRIPNFIEISKGWIAIITALMVLSLTSYEDVEGMLARIDWATMLFFVTLSIVMQVLIRLGLLENIGLLFEHFIVNISEENRLAVAILGTTWISAILSTFIDNVPVADMMLRIIGTLSLNQDMNLPIMPLVWSLVLGCNLGGNGSIVAAFANIACSGEANRHGFHLTFCGYFKIGFLIMLGNVLVASIYLLIAHVVFQWH